MPTRHCLCSGGASSLSRSFDPSSLSSAETNTKLIRATRFCHSERSRGISYYFFFSSFLTPNFYPFSPISPSAIGISHSRPFLLRQRTNPPCPPSDRLAVREAGSSFLFFIQCSAPARESFRSWTLGVCFVLPYLPVGFHFSPITSH